jgi:2-polyprenyl-3-methyl-5-hydroxy-6-metoxy-1,4-benzoquinol methylase
MFVATTPTIEQLRIHYSEPNQYEEWLINESGRDVMWEKRLKLILKNINHGNLLDISTGTGQFLQHAKRYFNVTGTEISLEAAKIAKEKYNLDLTVGNNSLESLPDNCYDVITLFHVLEHVDNPKQLILQARQKLKHEGYLIIAVPNSTITNFHTLKDVYLKNFAKKILTTVHSNNWKINKRFSPLTFAAGEEIHLSHFVRSSLRFLLENNDYKIIKDSIDPYLDKQALYQDIRFIITKIIYKLTKINFYETIWITAQKK